jgi:hypothetical protein
MNTTPQPGQPESGRSPGPFYTCKIASLYFRQFILLAFAFASLYFCPLAKADIGWTFNQCVQAWGNPVSYDISDDMSLGGPIQRIRCYTFTSAGYSISVCLLNNRVTSESKIKEFSNDSNGFDFGFTNDDSSVISAPTPTPTLTRQDLSHTKEYNIKSAAIRDAYEIRSLTLTKEDIDNKAAEFAKEHGLNPTSPAEPCTKKHS